MSPSSRPTRSDPPTVSRCPGLDAVPALGAPRHGPARREPGSARRGPTRATRLKLARGFIDRLELAAGESPDDAVAGCTAVAMPACGGVRSGTRRARPDPRVHPLGVPRRCTRRSGRGERPPVPLGRAPLRSAARDRRLRAPRDSATHSRREWRPASVSGASSSSSRPPPDLAAGCLTRVPAAATAWTQCRRSGCTSPTGPETSPSAPRVLAASLMCGAPYSPPDPATGSLRWSSPSYFTNTLSARWFPFSAAWNRSGNCGPTRRSPADRLGCSQLRPAPRTHGDPRLRPARRIVPHRRMEFRRVQIPVARHPPTVLPLILSHLNFPPLLCVCMSINAPSTCPHGTEEGKGFSTVRGRDLSRSDAEFDHAEWFPAAGGARSRRLLRVRPRAGRDRRPLAWRTDGAATFSLTETQRSSGRRCASSQKDRIAPQADAADRDATFPQKSFDACVELELPALGIPVAYGGAGADMVTQTIMAEELARVCASTSLTMLISKLGMLPVMTWGSEELKRDVPSPGGLGGVPGQLLPVGGGRRERRGRLADACGPRR